MFTGSQEKWPITRGVDIMAEPNEVDREVEEEVQRTLALQEQRGAASIEITKQTATEMDFTIENIEGLIFFLTAAALFDWRLNDFMKTLLIQVEKRYPEIPLAIREIQKREEE